MNEERDRLTSFSDEGFPPDMAQEPWTIGEVVTAVIAIGVFLVIVGLVWSLGGCGIFAP